jgi:hypothetical protein
MAALRKSRDASPDEFTSEDDQARPSIVKVKNNPDGQSTPRKFPLEELSKDERKLYTKRVLDLQNDDHRLQARTTNDPPYTDDVPCHQCARERCGAIANGKEVDRPCGVRTGTSSLRCSNKACENHTCFRM